MANIISLLKLEELSLVDNPANPLAMAPLYKRNSNEGDDMTKQTEKTEEVDIESMKADVNKFKSENQMLRKALIENGFVIRADSIEKKAEEEYIEIEGEKINKSEIPATLLKKMEEDAAELAAAKVEKRELALVKKAEEILPHVNKDHAKVLVEKFEDNEDMVDFLKSIDALFADKMEEVGKKDDINGDMSSPEDAMETLTKAYMAENRVSYAVAYAEVAKTDAGKKLINEYYKEKGE